MSDADLPESAETRLVRFEVLPEHEGMRVDAFLTVHCNGYSRMFMRGVVQEGGARVSGEKRLGDMMDAEVVRPSFRVRSGQIVECDLPPIPDQGPQPENIALDVIFEDDHLIVINKPAGMVVHPAKGHWSGTLTSALAYRFKELSDVGGVTRPGIVHRLDRDTSGVICIAKTNALHLKLAALFESRDIQKEYVAISLGSVNMDRDRIYAPIGHHPYQRDKMAIRADHETSKEAETFFEVTERFTGYTLVRVFPKTGRTHQIRVHLAHVGHPVLCDRLYAGHARVTRGQLLRKQARGLPLLEEDATIVLERQALHAARIAFKHPLTGQELDLQAPLATDIANTLSILRSQKQT